MLIFEAEYMLACDCQRLRACQACCKEGLLEFPSSYSSREENFEISRRYMHLYEYWKGIGFYISFSVDQFIYICSI